MMHKGFLKTAGFLGAVSVLLGAFAAHKLKSIVGDSVVSIFETAVRYQFYHVFALLAVGILYENFGGRFLKMAGFLFILGIILFSGSLYFLTYTEALVKPGYKWVGAITPIGGACFIGGWICLALGIKRK